MQRNRFLLLGILLLCTLVSCRTQTILRNTSQDKALQERYSGKPFYTAIVSARMNIETHTSADVPESALAGSTPYLAAPPVRRSSPIGVARSKV